MSVIASPPQRPGHLDVAMRMRADRPRAAEGASALQGAAFWAIAALLTAAFAAPLFLVNIAPMTDFPAHLARVTLLSHLPLDPTLARYWAVDLRPLPNLAMDLFVPTLAKAVGAKIAMKIFVALGVALWVAGAALIYRALWREWSIQPLFAVFFAVNASFYYGFSNFHVGAGLALTATGLWLLAARRTPALVAAMAATALALLFSHLMAAALFGLLLGGFELGRLWRERAGAKQIVVALATLAAIFLPAALIWAFVFEHGRETGVEFKWLHNLLAIFIYSSGAGAIRYNFVPAAAMFAAFGLAWRAGRLDVSREALPVCALMLLATLLCPAVAMSGAIIHVRLPAVACILFLCAARVRVDPRWVRPALAALLAVSLGLGGVEWMRWRAGDAVIADIRAAANAHIETGARVATALASVNDFALAHGVDLTALDRKAFVPSFFTTKGQSTIIVRDAYKRIAAADTIEGAFPTFAEVAPMLGAHRVELTPEQLRALRPYRDLACDFDYLYVIGHLPAGAPLPAALKTLVVGDGFTLFRIVAPPQRGCAPR
jgi:hypothetical protein